MATERRTNAQVTVTLVIPVADAWSPDVRADQVYRQAKESALGMLNKGILVDGVAVRMTSCRVTAIISEIER